MLNVLKTTLLATLVVFGTTGLALADDDAASQAESAQQDGSNAVSATTDEAAHSDAGQTFDGTTPPVVDTTTPSEGSSGLDNAPTYNESSGSGLDNAPTQ